MDAVVATGTARRSRSVALTARDQSEGDENVAAVRRNQGEMQYKATESAASGSHNTASSTVSGGALGHQANRAAVSMAVLAAAAVAIAIAAFTLGQLAYGGSDGPELVDTADCRVIAASVSEGTLEPGGCSEPYEAGTTDSAWHRAVQLSAPAPTLVIRAVSATGSSPS